MNLNIISSTIKYIPQTIDIFLIDFASILFAYNFFVNIVSSKKLSNAEKSRLLKMSVPDNSVYVRDPYEVEEKEGEYYIVYRTSEGISKKKISQRDYELYKKYVNYNNVTEYVLYNNRIQKCYAILAILFIVLESFLQIKSIVNSVFSTVVLLLFYVVLSAILFVVINKCIALIIHEPSKPEKPACFREIDEYYSTKN